MSKPRRPHLSASVMEGLLSMVNRMRVEDSCELLARTYVRRMAEYRAAIGCRSLTAQDARCCLPSAPGPESTSGPGEETKETRCE
jgi:hypothetical protein